MAGLLYSLEQVPTPGGTVCRDETFGGWLGHKGRAVVNGVIKVTPGSSLLLLPCGLPWRRQLSTEQERQLPTGRKYSQKTDLIKEFLSKAYKIPKTQQ